MIHILCPAVPGDQKYKEVKAPAASCGASKKKAVMTAFL
jgi:hypothetical protein